MEYYQYAGSLTTPPCTEGVRWVVLERAATLSQGQLARFPYSNNFRPPQPLYARRVSRLSDSAPLKPAERDFFFDISEHADGERRGRVSIQGSRQMHLTETFPKLPSDPI